VQFARQSLAASVAKAWFTATQLTLNAGIARAYLGRIHQHANRLVVALRAHEQQADTELDARENSLTDENISTKSLLSNLKDTLSFTR